MIHYSCGMGLICAHKKDGQWRLGLTTLGDVVATEDPYLSEPVTLWLLHLQFCRRANLKDPPRGVADAWFALFAEGAVRLGNEFKQSDFLNYLTARYGAKSYLKGLAGLILRSYLEPTCFGEIKALSAEGAGEQGMYLRYAAPTDSSYFPAYSAYLFLLWESLFHGQSQLEIDELFTQSRCLSVMGWDRIAATRWLDWMADQGLIQLDRQTGGTMALKLCDTDTVIKGIFDELV